MKNLRQIKINVIKIAGALILAMTFSLVANANNCAIKVYCEGTNQTVDCSADAIYGTTYCHKVKDSDGRAGVHCEAWQNGYYDRLIYCPYPKDKNGNYYNPNNRSGFPNKSQGWFD